MNSDPNLSYLCAAFSAVWCILFAYIMRLSRRGKMLAERLRELEQ